MSAQVQLFQEAKRVFRQHGTGLSDEEAGERCGLGQHVLAAWSENTPERMTIRNARRDVENDTPQRVDHGGGSGYFPHL